MGGDCLVSNVHMVHQETDMRTDRLKRLYPEKLLEKIVDAFAGDEDTKKRRSSAEIWLNNHVHYYAYLSTHTLYLLQNAIIKAMSNKPPYSAADICTFEELKPFHLTAPFWGQNSAGWGEMFVIQAMQPLIEKGIFEDKMLNDTDPLDNHVYYCLQSTIQMKSIDAGSDPRLADPELCD